jgi:hypothetical protein
MALQGVSSHFSGQPGRTRPVAAPAFAPARLAPPGRPHAPPLCRPQIKCIGILVFASLPLLQAFGLISGGLVGPNQFTYGRKTKQA